MSGHSPDNPWAEPQRRPRWGLFLLSVMVLGGCFTLFDLVVVSLRFPKKPPPALDAVSAVSGRLTLEPDDGKSLEVVDRQISPEVWYRVTLDNAPVGHKLSLVCEWVGPDGKLAKRARYQTRVIDRPDCPMHELHRFGPSSPLGRWTVRLLLEGRVLHSLTFEVCDGKKGAP